MSLKQKHVAIDTTEMMDLNVKKFFLRPRWILSSVFVSVSRSGNILIMLSPNMVMGIVKNYHVNFCCLWKQHLPSPLPENPFWCFVIGMIYLLPDVCITKINTACVSKSINHTIGIESILFHRKKKFHCCQHVWCITEPTEVSQVFLLFSYHALEIGFVLFGGAVWHDELHSPKPW